MVGHSTISLFHLTNLPPYRVYRVHLFSSPLLHEGCNNRSSVYLDFSLFNPHTCNNWSGTLQNGCLEFGYWDRQLWILVCTANNSCISLPFHTFSMDGKAIQDAKKWRFIVQWTLLCWKILHLLNIIHSMCGVKLYSFSCVHVCELVYACIQNYSSLTDTIKIFIMITNI